MPFNRRVLPPRVIGLIAVCLTLVLPAALSRSARAADPGVTLGVYAGSGNVDGVGAFESRLGRSVHRVHDMLSKTSWSSITDVGWTSARWNATRYAHRVVYSVPMLPDTGGTLAQGASGAYNEHFRTLALALVAAGEGSATLRVGWEFNGSWYRWSIGVPNGPADFAEYWRQIVRTMRGVAGANFKFDWTASNGSSWVDGVQLEAASAWPGDAYVDYVGMDIYDQSWGPWNGDAVARWNEYVTQRNGLAWQRQFAAAHGKPISLPEWGLGHRHDGNGGGDEPYFIESMYEWIRTSAMGYHTYFEFSDSNLDARLFGGRSPRASARFVELFGAGATGAPIVPTPPPGSGSSPYPGAGSGAGAGGAGEGAAAMRAQAEADAEGAGAGAASLGSEPTKLSISRARILPRARRLDLIAPITRRASGDAQVELHAGGRRTTFQASIDSRRGRLKLRRSIPAGQARRATGILTITYPGNSRTRPQEVRLRAARRSARLTAARPKLRGDRLQSRGRVTRVARGVVRLQLVYDVGGRHVTRRFRAKIRNGRWSLDAALSKAVRDEIARRDGTVHSYTLFTGYGPRMIGGAMKSYQVLGHR